MIFDSAKAAQLLKLIHETHEQEISCDECLIRLSELVESRLRGMPLSDALQEVAAHLEACGDCSDEYEALRAAVKTIGEPR